MCPKDFMWIEWVTTLALVQRLSALHSFTLALCSTLDSSAWWSVTQDRPSALLANTSAPIRPLFPLPSPKSFFYLAISPSCLQLFMNGWSSNFPLAEKEGKKAKFFLPSSFITSSSSCSGGSLNLSYKRCSIRLLFQRKSDLLWYEPGYSLICNPMQCILVWNVNFSSLLQLMFIFLILALDCKLLQHGFIEWF